MWRPNETLLPQLDQRIICYQRTYCNCFEFIMTHNSKYGPNQLDGDEIHGTFISKSTQIKVKKVRKYERK